MVRSPADPNGEPEYVFERSKREEWAEIVRFKKPKAEARHCRDHRLPGVWSRESFWDMGSVIRTNCCDAYWRMCALDSFGLVTWEQVEWIGAIGEEWRPVKTKLGFRVKSR